jgi:hypothetical protein
MNSNFRPSSKTAAHSAITAIPLLVIHQVLKIYRIGARIHFPLELGTLCGLDRGIQRQSQILKPEISGTSVTECQAGVPLSHVGFVHYGAEGWPPSISHLTRIDSILLVVFFLKSARVLHSFRNSCICCPLPVVAIASSKGLRKRMRCHDGRSESCEVSD